MRLPAAAAEELREVSSSPSSSTLRLPSRLPTSLHLPLPTGYTWTFESVPGLSINMLIILALVGDGLMPPWLRARVLEALGPDGRAAYHPTIAGPALTYPSFMVPTIGARPGWVKGAHEEIADVPQVDLEFVSDELLDPDAPHWRDIVRTPRPWLDRVAAAFDRVATAVEPIRAANAGRFAVEEQRFAMMAEAQILPHFFTGVSTQLELGDQELRFDWSEDVTLPTQSSRVIVVPLYSSAGQTALHTAGGLGRPIEGSPLVVGYPVAGLHQWTDPSTRPLEPEAVDRVETVLGRARASIVRAATPPATMGALARFLDIAPSTARHHVAKLVESGLMASYQVGKEVWVLRTAAGDQLLNLLD